MEIDWSQEAIATRLSEVCDVAINNLVEGEIPEEQLNLVAEDLAYLEELIIQRARLMKFLQVVYFPGEKKPMHLSDMAACLLAECRGERPRET